jgi:hypothetical protein
LNLHVLSHNVGSSVDPLSRIVANGIRKESDKDLVNWLGDLNIGKDVVEKVKKYGCFICTIVRAILKSTKLLRKSLQHVLFVSQIESPKYNRESQNLSCVG